MTDHIIDDIIVKFYDIIVKLSIVFNFCYYNMPVFLLNN